MRGMARSRQFALGLSRFTAARAFVQAAARRPTEWHTISDEVSYTLPSDAPCASRIASALTEASSGDRDAALSRAEVLRNQATALRARDGMWRPSAARAGRWRSWNRCSAPTTPRGIPPRQAHRPCTLDLNTWEYLTMGGGVPGSKDRERSPGGWRPEGELRVHGVDAGNQAIPLRVGTRPDLVAKG